MLVIDTKQNLAAWICEKSELETKQIINKSCPQPKTLLGFFLCLSCFEMVFGVTLEMHLNGRDVVQIFSNRLVGSVDCLSIHHAFEQYINLFK